MAVIEGVFHEHTGIILYPSFFFQITVAIRQKAVHSLVKQHISLLLFPLCDFTSWPFSFVCTSSRVSSETNTKSLACHCLALAYLPELHNILSLPLPPPPASPTTDLISPPPQRSFTDILCHSPDAALPRSLLRFQPAPAPEL